MCVFFRQLEAIIRIAESQAKMRLSAFATPSDVNEALRLFQVSTLDAATSGNLAGALFVNSDDFYLPYTYPHHFPNPITYLIFICCHSLVGVGLW